jgi:hypothetical protein
LRELNVVGSARKQGRIETGLGGASQTFFAERKLSKRAATVVFLFSYFFYMFNT